MWLNWAAGFAQKPDSVQLLMPPSIEDFQRQSDLQAGIHAKVFSSAMTSQDYPTAIVALHYMIVADPLNVPLKVELVELYVRTGQFSQAITCGQPLKGSGKDEVRLLRNLGDAYAGLGQHEPALECYRDADRLQPDPFLRYQIAGLQFQLGRYVECRQTVEALLTEPGIHDVIILVRSGSIEQEVYLDAALHNLLGNLELQAENISAARTAFLRALEIQPAFVLAKQNLDGLKKGKK